MLTGCPKCGKPVYYRADARRAECAFCYAALNPTPDTPRLKPGEIDWKRPLYDEALRTQDSGAAARLLGLAGDYLDAPQQLHRAAVAAELEK